MEKLKGLYILAEGALPLIYGPDEQRDIREQVEIYAPPQTRESITQNPELLQSAEAIFSGWGAPVLDAKLLQAAPQLKAFFYGAGATSRSTGAHAMPSTIWRASTTLRPITIVSRSCIRKSSSSRAA